MGDPATEAALREMSRIIGGLESSVKTMVSTWQSQEASASQGRRDLHTKFDTLADKVSGLSSKVDAMGKDLTEIKPSVDAFKNAKEQAIGAQKLGKWIWAALPFAGGGIGWMIANWVSITPRPPTHWTP